MLPAWLTVYFTLALALFMDMGAGRVMRKLAGVLAWAERGVTVVIPSEEALSNARTRLGPAPLRLLFEKTAGVLARPGTPGAFWRGRRPGPLGGAPPGHLGRQGAEDITVRVIEYHIQDASGEVTETFSLITTLLDPETAPARELAGLYHARWEIETAIGAFKTEMKGAGIVLRSKTPEGAEQEVWALLCAYHAIRELICAAAALARQDPLRTSFVNALHLVRGHDA